MSSDDLESIASGAHNNDDLSGAENNLDENGQLESEVDDLFGDVDDESEPVSKQRALDDSEIDSGDDEGRADRAIGEEAMETEHKNITVQLLNLPRTVVPEPCDNEMYLVKIPQFLAIQPTAYKLQTFQPPTTDHHSKLPPSASFDAYDTAITTIRWRHSPSDPSELQSNARILRWADGSLTLQMATNAVHQYEIMGNPLAPPQTNPRKPTPIASAAQSRKQQSSGMVKDSFTYLAAPFPSTWGIRLTNKFTASLAILPKKDSAEEVKASIAALKARYRSETERGGVKITNVNMDFEKVKAEALKQERENERRLRKVERDQEKQLKFGRAGGRGGGLTIDDLEGEGRPRQPRQKRRQSQRDILSDEEEEMYGPRGGPNDAYDMEDDFLNDDDEGSDEDAEGEEDIDAVIERNEKQRKTGRAPSPKRGRQDDEDGSRNPDSPVSRHKRRRVVSDDDDD